MGLRVLFGEHIGTTTAVPAQNHVIITTSLQIIDPLSMDEQSNGAYTIARRGVIYSQNPNKPNRAINSIQMVHRPDPNGGVTDGSTNRAMQVQGHS